MDASALLAWCLEQPGEGEQFPFGPEHAMFKVAGKMFALSALDATPLEVSVKCEPELALELRASYSAIRPGYHLNRHRWNTLRLDGRLPDQLVRDLIEDPTTSWSARCQRGCATNSAGRPARLTETGSPHDGLGRPTRT